ncbi:MAG: fatty acid desaturase [Rhizorhabdus sp.]
MGRVATGKRRRSIAVALPTLAVAASIHGGWLALTWYHAALPAWLVALAGACLIAWHGSLQHETIHGHPTNDRRLNALIGGVPLALWLPYPIYRRSHLAHHATPAITDPLDDPESRYLSGRSGPAAMLLARLQAPLLGRLLLGPAIAIGGFLAEEAARAFRRPGEAARDWLPHLAGVAAVLVWLHLCEFAIWRYVLLCAYPATALTLLRSFAEHRADRQPGKRVAIVEARGLLALLYLNNNLHAAHHRAPHLPWYALPSYYARHRAALLAENGGLVYRGYAQVIARFLLRPHDVLVHPDHA